MLNINRVLARKASITEAYGAFRGNLVQIFKA
jgi:hypothetical protein